MYETPPVAVRALLRVERLPYAVWEPSCGPGAIVRELRGRGHRVHASDLIAYGCPGAVTADFLRVWKAPRDCYCILTNPPFKHAHAFAKHALELAPKVILLLRLAFLEGERRKDVLDTGRLRRVHVFARRLPMMHRAGWQGPKASSAIAFAWFVWERQKGRAVIDRIDF